jgi:zinc transport system substrate-binding protein
VCALALAMVVAACGATSGPLGDDRLAVVTTIYPLEYMTSRIGGDDTEVSVLIGAGVEAHTFEPAPSDVQRLSEARLVVANGLDLEPWLARIVDGMGEESKPVVVEAADIEGFERLEGSDEHEDEEGHTHETDPHVWLDPVLAQKQAERIRDALSEVDPDNAESYADRAQELIDDLAGIHQEYVDGLVGCAHDHFVTTHAAYGHLAKRYGLEQISIAGISAEAEPTPRDLADLTERVESLGLKHVLVEPGIGARLAETVAAEAGLELLPVHQMESVTEQEMADHGDYLGLMRDNLKSLKAALECAG